MSGLKRCWICLNQSRVENLIAIYGNDGKIGTELFLISGVMIVEISSSNKPTKICRSCLKQLEKAIEFRKLIKSNEHLRKILSEDEKKCWNKNKKLMLKEPNIQEPKKAEVFIKLEPIKDEYGDDQILENDEWDFDDFNADAASSPEPALLEPLKKEKPEKVKKSTKKINTTKKVNPMKKIDPVSKRTQKCQVCDKVFSEELKNYNFYTVHMKRHKERNEWPGIPCSKCDKIFLSYWSLGGHNKKHHPIVGKLICDVCGKACVNRIKMKTHFRYEHSSIKHIVKSCAVDRMLPCTLCGKFFKSPAYLRKHEIMHNKLEPSEYFYCDVCGNKFKVKSDLLTHIKFIHIAKRRFHCPKCPGLSWLRKNGLKRHMLKHQNIREFKCDICQKEFIAAYEVRIHKRIHTGETPYQCKYCEKKFIHQTDCRRHEWGHTGYKGNFKCPNCDKAFFKNSELQSHLSRCYEQKIQNLMSLI